MTHNMDDLVFDQLRNSTSLCTRNHWLLSDKDLSILLHCS